MSGVKTDSSVGSLCLTLSKGDSVILAGKDIIEVEYKERYSSNQIRIVFTADKDVKISRRARDKR